MPLEVEHHDQSLTLTDSQPLIRVGFGRNRLHFHPHVLRLHFEVLAELERRDLSALLEKLLLELGEVTNETAPLLYRTTLPEESALIGPLKGIGFLETRRVYEPVLCLGDIDPKSIDTRVADIEVRSLAELIHEDRQTELLDLYIEVYSRVSRLDPATPLQLGRNEWFELLFADVDLLPDLSYCALIHSRPVGLTTIYKTHEDSAYELVS